MRHKIQPLLARRTVPAATYRLQFSSQFTFARAAELAPYLGQLGITHLYASPVFQARAQSPHGYDGCDFNRLSSELGGEAQFENLVNGLKSHGLGLLLDMVPNHMGIGDLANRWWLEVLEFGPSSNFARFFDIDWRQDNPALPPKVLLPVLGDLFGKVLESGELRLVWERDALWVAYCQNRWPVSPLGYKLVAASLAELDDGKTSCGNAVARLVEESPPAGEPGVAQPGERRTALADLVATHPGMAETLATVLSRLNGEPGNPASFSGLQAILDAQYYRLAYWRVAAQELNYRRFFDITDLAGLRMEDPLVFEAAHRLLMRLLAEDKVQGVRIDHPDGLRDPAGYFAALQKTFLARLLNRSGEGQAGGQSQAAADAWVAEELALADGSARRWPLYVVAEKILSPGEQLPSNWPVDGTTGYDFTNLLNALFVDQANEGAFDRLYGDFIGGPLDFHATANCAKKNILENSLAAETGSLTARLKEVATRHRHGRDFTAPQFREALIELMAALPVYRTYLTDQSSAPSLPDRKFLEQALAEAANRNPRVAASLWEFLGRLLRLENLAEFAVSDRPLAREFVLRFQQVTGPATAKGLEDTTFYVYNRLLSLNEVGGHPAQFGIPVEEFHRLNRERQARWPHSLLATSTHDTKRGEDARARLNVLSEMPEEWGQALGLWRELNVSAITRLEGQPAPDANDQYLLYQTLLAAWPDTMDSASVSPGFVERIKEYLRKAAREAKRHTSWTDQNPAYEDALLGFAERLLTRPEAAPFRGSFVSFQRRVAYHGRFSSLSQVLLKIASPGVPDFYQGSELWELSLVDPDNRRPVDFGARQELLAQLRRDLESRPVARVAAELMENPSEPRLKLFVTYLALNCRRQHPEIFSQGAYQPLAVAGARQRHLCAFARTQGQFAMAVAAPRLVCGLAGGQLVPPIGGVWEETDIVFPDSSAWQSARHLFTGEDLRISARGSLRVADALKIFPVALLQLS